MDGFSGRIRIFLNDTNTKVLENLVGKTIDFDVWGSKNAECFVRISVPAGTRRAGAERSARGNP